MTQLQTVNWSTRIFIPVFIRLLRAAGVLKDGKQLQATITTFCHSVMLRTHCKSTCFAFGGANKIFLLKWSVSPSFIGLFSCQDTERGCVSWAQRKRHSRLYPSTGCSGGRIWIGRRSLKWPQRWCWGWQQVHQLPLLCKTSQLSV